MRDFENDNLNPQHDDQTPKNEWEAPRADEEKPSEEPQKESPMREEPFRDIYGHTYVPKEPPKPPKKKRSEVKMSGGAFARLLVWCMLVSILAGAGLNYVFGDGPALAGPSTSDTTTTAPTQNETTAATDGTTEKPTETLPGETAPSINIGTGSVIGNTDFPEYEVYASVANECIKSVVIIRVTETVLS